MGSFNRGSPVRGLLLALRGIAAWVGALLLVVSFTPLPRYWIAALSTPWRTDNSGILIVLGGDIASPDMIGMGSYWRCVYTVREWRTGRYSRIILAGRDVAPLMKDFLVGQGVPAQAITVENTSESTRGNALAVAKLSGDFTGPRTLLTSDFHMRRASAVFRKAGIAVNPLPIPDAAKRLGDWKQRWGIFCNLSEETAKLLYYKAHSWV